MPNWTFSPLLPRHLDQICLLEQRCFSVPWSRMALESELDNPLAPWVVCLQGEQVVGYIGCLTAADQGEITNVAVLPEARRQGIAWAMLTRALEILGRRGVEQVFLEVRESNLPARALYERAGFSQVGRRRHYYAKPEEDALILGRKLI